MRLVYAATQKPVKFGDPVTLNGQQFTVDSFRKPHKPDSEGKVSLRQGNWPFPSEVYVSIIGAEWIEREDRAEPAPQA